MSCLVINKKGKESKLYSDLVKIYGPDRALELFNIAEAQLDDPAVEELLDHVDKMNETSVQMLSYSEIRERVRSYIPDADKKRDINFITTLMLNDISAKSGGQSIGNRGGYINGMLYFASNDTNKASLKLVRHEIFHKIFTEYLTKSEQKTLFENFKKEFEVYTIEEFEEQLAIQFEDYKKGNYKPSSNFVEIIFNKILRFFGLLKANTKNINSLFEQIENNKLVLKVEQETNTFKASNLTNKVGNAENYIAIYKGILSDINEFTNIGETRKMDKIRFNFLKSEFDLYVRQPKIPTIVNGKLVFIDNPVFYWRGKTEADNRYLNYETDKEIIEKRIKRIEGVFKYNANYTSELIRRKFSDFELLETIKLFNTVVQDSQYTPLVNTSDASDSFKSIFNKSLQIFRDRKLSIYMEGIIVKAPIYSQEEIKTRIVERRAEQIKKAKEDRDHYKTTYLEPIEKDKGKESEEYAQAFKVYQEKQIILNRYLYSLMSKGLPNLNIRLGKLLSGNLEIDKYDNLEFFFSKVYPQRTSSERFTDITFEDEAVFDDEGRRVDEEEGQENEFNLDPDKWDASKKVSANVKAMLSTIQDPNDSTNFLSFNYAYYIALQLLIDQPTLTFGKTNLFNDLDWDKSLLFKRLQELGDNPAHRAVYERIKDIYLKSSNPEYINDAGTSDAIPKSFHFINENLFIYTTNSLDISDIATKEELMRRKAENPNIKFIERGSVSGVKYYTIDFYYQIMAEIQNDKNISPELKDKVKNFDLIRSLAEKAFYTNILRETMQNINSLRENRRFVAEVKEDMKGIESRYFLGRTSDTKDSVKGTIADLLAARYPNKKALDELPAKVLNLLNAKTFAEFNTKAGNLTNKERITLINQFLDLILGESAFTQAYNQITVEAQSASIISSITNFFLDPKTSYYNDAYITTTEEKEEYNEETNKKEKIKIANVVSLKDVLMSKGKEGFLLDHIASYISKTLRQERAAFTLSVSGVKKYNYTPSSTVVNTLTMLSNLTTGLVQNNNIIIPGYEYMNTSFFKQNIMNPASGNKIQKIHNWFEHDGVRTTYGFGSGKKVTLYQRELPVDYLSRAFNLGFLNTIYNKNSRYSQYLPILSNRTKALAAEVNLLNHSDVREVLGLFVDRFINKQQLENVNSFDPTKVVNFNIFIEAAKRVTTMASYKKVKVDGNKVDLSAYVQDGQLDKELRYLLIKNMEEELELITDQFIQKVKEYEIPLYNFSDYNVEAFDEYSQQFYNYDKLESGIIDVVKKLIAKGGKFENSESLNKLLAQLQQNKSDMGTKFSVRLFETWRETTERFIKEQPEVINDLIETHGMDSKDIANYLYNKTNNRLENQYGYKRKYKSDYIDTIKEVFEIFIKNDYINNFYLDELLMGDAAQFKNSEDRVKRRQGVSSPGLVGYVDGGRLGMRQNFTYGVIKDKLVLKEGNTDPTTDLKSFFIDQLGFTESEYKELESLFGDSFEASDGQGFMLPERLNDITRGFGLSYQAGAILKPQYYAVDKHGVARMVKYSSIVLTNNMIKTFPKLERIRDKMRTGYINSEGMQVAIDELVFESAIKVGKPKSMAELSLLDNDVMFSQDNTFEAQNMNYRLQLNPLHEFDENEGVAKPTQLLYFLKLLNTNKTSTNTIYNSLGKIIDFSLEELRNKFYVDGKLDNEAFIKHILSLVNEDDPIYKFLKVFSYSNKDGKDGTFLSMSEAWNYPAITDKLINQLISNISSEVIETRFRGGKLILQSQVGSEEKLIGLEDDKQKFRKELKYINENGTRYAECYLPKGYYVNKNGLKEDVSNLSESVKKEWILSGKIEWKGFISEKEQLQLEEQFKRNREFNYGDAIAIRIPTSELHSSIVLRVAGFVENLDANIIIVPEMVVYLHGSDFDVDSLFVMKRQGFDKLNVFKDTAQYNKFTPGFFEDGRSDYVGYKIDEGSEKYSLMSNDEFKTYLVDIKSELLRLEVSLSKVESILTELKVVREKNVIVEELMKVSSSENNKMRMFSPISFMNLAAQKKKYSALNSSLNIGYGLDESHILHRQRVHSSSMVGLSSVGATANTMKALAYVTPDTDNGFLPLNDTSTFELYTQLGTIDKLQLGNIAMWRELDGLLNAALDNVKEQILPYLRITPNTQSLFIVMLATGHTLDQTMPVMLQPFMKSISEIGGYKFNKPKWINEVGTLFRPEHKVDVEITEEKLNRIVEKFGHLSLKQLLQRTDVTVEDIAIQYKLYTNAVKMFDISQGLFIFKLTQYINPLTKSLPVFPEMLNQAIATEKTIFGSEDSDKVSDNFPLKLENFHLNNPHIGAARNVLHFVRDLLEDNFYKHSPLLTDLIKSNPIIENIRLDINEYKDIELKKEQFNQYLFSMMYNYVIDEDILKSTNRIKVKQVGDTTPTYRYGYSMDLELDGRRAFIQHFLNKVKILKGRVSDNLFLDRFFIYDIGKSGLKRSNFLNTKYVSDLDFELLERSFNELREYNVENITAEEYATNKDNADYYAIPSSSNSNVFYHYKVIRNELKVSQLQADFIRYGILYNGLKGGASGFGQYINADIVREYYYKFERISKALVKNEEKVTELVDHFSAELALNFSGDLKVMDNITIDGRSYGEENGIFYDLKIKSETPLPVIKKERGKFQDPNVYQLFYYDTPSQTAYYSLVGSANRNKIYNLDNAIVSDILKSQSTYNKSEKYDARYPAFEVNFHTDKSFELQNQHYLGKLEYFLGNKRVVFNNEIGNSIIFVYQQGDVTRNTGKFVRLTSKGNSDSIYNYVEVEKNEIITPDLVSKLQAQTIDMVEFDKNVNTSVGSNVLVNFDNNEELTKTVNSLPITPRQKLIYDLLLENDVNWYSQIKVKDGKLPNKGRKKTLGRFDMKTFTITLDREANNNDPIAISNTLQHELVHGKTAYKIALGKEGFLVDPVEQQAYDRLLNLFRLTKNTYSADKKKGKTFEFDEYWMKDIDEFAAEAMSNQKFQDYLISKKVNRKSLFIRFVEIVSNLLSLPDDNLYVDILSTILQLTSSPLSLEEAKLVGLSTKERVGGNIPVTPISDTAIDTMHNNVIGGATTDKTYTLADNGQTVNRITDEFRGIAPLASGWNVDREDTTLGQKLADRKYGTDETIKLFDRDEGKELTKEEFIKAKDFRFNVKRLHGNIIDAYFQYKLTNDQKYLDVINAAKNELPDEEKFKVRVFEELLQQLPLVEEAFSSKMLSNAFLPYVLPQLRDKISGQIKTFSKGLGFGGTMDILIEHADGMFSLYDIKSGSLSSEFYRSMFIYGETPGHTLYNNSLNRAKLQTLMYALMAKLNKPSMKFRRVGLVRFPLMDSKYRLLNYFRSNDNTLNTVEVEKFLPMLEKIFKDKNAAIKLGLLPEGSTKTLYELLAEEYLANGGQSISELFDYKNYSNVHSDVYNSNVTNTLTNPDNPKTIDLAERIQYLQKKIRLYSASNVDDSKWKQTFEGQDASTSKRREHLDEMLRYTEELILLTKPQWVDFNVGKGINGFQLWVGTAKDIDDPIVILWNRLRQEKLLLMDEKTFTFRNNLNIKMAAMGFDFKNALQYNDYRKMFGKFIILDKPNVKGGLEVERLIHKGDGVLYTNLTPAEQDFLDFLNDTFASYFAENSYLNSEASLMYFDDATKSLSHLQVYENTSGNKFSYYPGWFPKTPPTAQEERNRDWNESENGVKFVGKRFQDWKRSTLSNFVENNYTNQEERIGIPIKYLGNLEIEMQKDYSVKLDEVFMDFVIGMTHKELFDDLYHYGRSLTMLVSMEEMTYLEHNPLDKGSFKKRIKGSKILGENYTINPQTGRTQLIRENTIKWIKDRMRMELQGINIKYTKEPRSTPIDKFGNSFNSDKAILYASNLATGTVMHLKPLNAAGNMLAGMVLQHNQALKYSIARRFIKEEEASFIDFTLSTLIKAEKEYMTYVTDSAMGKVRENKMFLFADKYNYLTDNFSFGQNKKRYRSDSARVFDYDNLYLFHTLAENYLSYTTMVAQLKQYKIKYKDVSGLEVEKSMWDLYEVAEYDKNGELTDKGKGGTGVFGLRWTGPKRFVKDGEITKVINGVSEMEIARFKAVSAKMFGDYRSSEKTKADGYAIYKIFTTLKKFFQRIILNGIQPLQDTDELGFYKVVGETDGISVLEWNARVTEGKWRTMLTFLGMMFNINKNKGTFTEQLKALAPEQKMNLLEAVITGALIATMFGLGALMFGDADDDDTLRKMWTIYLVQNSGQQYNLLDLLRTSKTYFSPVVFQKAYDMSVGFSTVFFSSIHYGLGNEEKAFTQEGNLRGLPQFLKSTPYVAWAYDLYRKANNIDTQNYFTFSADEKLR